MARPLRSRVALLSVVLLAVLAACSKTNTPSSTGTTPPTSPSSSPAMGSGPVKVLYAGSLAGLMQNQIGPEFHVAAGYTFDGTSGDSGTLSNGIISGVYAGSDVFISASPAKNTPLMNASTPFETWYATWATSPVVFAFMPSTTSGSVSETLSTSPWYTVMAGGKFKVGRTDPVSDPTAVLADEAVTMTAAAVPADAAALNAFVASTTNKYGETALPAEIESGQLDAGFVYQVEAKQQGLSYVPLTPPPGLNLSAIHATYTISILKNAPDLAGAEAFVNYLLGAPGQAFLNADQFTLAPVPLTPTGTATDVPAALSSVISS